MTTGIILARQTSKHGRGIASSYGIADGSIVSSIGALWREYIAPGVTEVYGDGIPEPGTVSLLGLGGLLLRRRSS